MSEFLNELSKTYRHRFETDKRLLSFSEYMVELESNPIIHFRNSTQYLLDTFDYFGTEKIETNTRKAIRYKLFDVPFSEDQVGIVLGQEEVQNQIYKILQNFISEGIPNRLILLHGSNGSSKSTIINAIIAALEYYSHTTEGAIYKFNWIFPLKEKEKGTVGFHKAADETIYDNSYAKLDPLKILSKLHCDVMDPPVFLIPHDDRIKLIERLKKSHKEFTRRKISKFIFEGQLCKKCSQIFEALIASYKGDYENVLSHVEVERIFISKRYNVGAVTIEPQLHVDAKSSMITYDKSLTYLPPVLQHMNFHVQDGPLVHASRGLLEYSDLLKRPIETWKYLLSMTETSSINLGDTILHLDTVLFGTCNENQLDTFKKTPEFSSFKARMELIRVPYLLEYQTEQKIYDFQLKQIKPSKHVTPHTTRLAALWAILTRLKKPDSLHSRETMQTIVQKITPMEKAFLYNNLEAIPGSFSPDESKELVGSIHDLINEYLESPFYEGRVGASPREIKNIILNSLQSSVFECLSPLSIFHELEELIKKTSEYEFLNIEPRDGYHDTKLFLHLVREFYLKLIEDEILDSLGFYEASDYENFINKYVFHLTHYVKKEKIKNPRTGLSEDPDESLMQSFEEQVGKPSNKDEFRRDILSSIGAFRIDNPDKPVVYREIFSTYFRKLQEYYQNKHKARIEELKPELENYSVTRNDEKLSETTRTTINNLIEKYNYCEKCAPETLLYFVRTRYN